MAFRRLISRLFKDTSAGLGITRASLVSAVCDKTGDEGQDAIVKVRRLINEKGPEFCDLTTFDFLNSDINFSITSSAYKYSGASYLPTTFKRVKAAYLLDSGNRRYDLTEVSISESYRWYNPDENTGIPDEFCITRIESGYWEIQFNRKPDQTYTVYMDIELQWTDLDDDTDEAVVTKRYYPQLAHFVSMARFIQQGDTENYTISKNDWTQPLTGTGILERMLASLINPLKKKQVKVDMSMTGKDTQTQSFNDYRK